MTLLITFNHHKLLMVTDDHNGDDKDTNTAN